MRARIYARFALALMLAGMANTRMFARPFALPDLGRLTDESTLVAVVDVGDVRVVPGAIVFPDQTKGEQRSAALEVTRVIKGSFDSSVLEVPFAFNPDPMRGGPWTTEIHPGDHLLVFLQCSAGCHFTDAAHAGFALQGDVNRLPAPAENTAANRVIRLLAATLFRHAHDSDPGTASPLSWDLLLLGSQAPSPYLDSLLHAALNDLRQDRDPDPRERLLAVLLRRGDLSTLPEVRGALTSSRGSVGSQVDLIYALQGVDWHIALPILAGTLGSSSSGVRLASARAVQNLGRRPCPPPSDLTAPATHLLLRALRDPDPEVSFAVMQTLGSLNDRLDQRPATSSPTPEWSACLQFWSTFPDPG